MLKIRKATKQDTDIIAQLIFSALGITDVTFEMLKNQTELCELTEVLYSYENAFVAEVDGERAGIVVGYDGGHYAEWRKKTFDILQQFVHRDFSVMVDETVAGEYYVDSLAVLPAFRRRGVARALLRSCIDEAKSMGLPLVTLAVDPQNESALKLYESCGFVSAGNLFIFEYNYMRMELKIR